MYTSFRETQARRPGDPIVSVVIPTYNRAHVLTRAIQSVLNQTYQDFEIIVVDDHSTDNTEEVVKSFNDPRIRYIRHEENRGAAAARNTGIMVAKGEFIAFQDSDDEWLPEKLEKQMQVFESASAKVGVVYTAMLRVQGRERIYIPSSKVKRKGGYIHDNLLEGNFVGTPTAVVKRECLKLSGVFDERLPRLQDWELFIRISKAYEFKCVDEPLVVSHSTPDSISANQATLIEALILILEKHSEDFRKDRRRLAKWQYSIGNLSCQSGRMDQGRDYLLRAVKSYPLNIKYLVTTFVALFGERAYNKVVRLKRRIRPAAKSYKEDLQ